MSLPRKGVYSSWLKEAVTRIYVYNSIIFGGRKSMGGVQARS
jgi:hypothetical protein